MPKLLQSYDEEVITEYSEDILARLFFLDGCAILQFIRSYINRSLNEFNIDNGQADFIRQDLFLFENQIPFQVLLLLMEKNANKSLLKSYLAEFLIANNVVEYGRGSDLYIFTIMMTSQPECRVSHLLDLLRASLISGNRVHKHKNFLEPFCDCLCALCCQWCCLPYWLFNVLENFAIYILSFFEYNWNQQQSFRNVQELKAAGITMKASDSRSLRDVCFRSGWFSRARVELLPLLVDSSTACKMMNLVAYEMCSPDYEKNCYVTSYINLLDLLIDDEEDVKVLRSADILRNRLSTDLEVARLFNSIGNACLAPPTDAYLEVKRDIEKHYKRKLSVWMAQFYHTHFSSPWTILALIAAVAVLLLTATQTWYAIHPKK